RVGALHGEQDGGCAPDPGVAARDDGVLAPQLPGCLVLLALAVVGRDLVEERMGIRHLALLARELLARDRDLVACLCERPCIDRVQYERLVLSPCLPLSN